ASETAVWRPPPGERALPTPSQVASPAGPSGSPVGSGLQNPPAPPPESEALLVAAASLSQGRSTPQAAGDVAPAFARDSQGEQVPFKGRLEGVVTVTPVDPLTDFVLVNGTGNATQLGQFTVTIPHLVDHPTRTATGSYHFVAANGDTLSADFTGQATLTPTPGVLSIVETATITGGTGRFAGATGSFTVERLSDGAAGTTTGPISGTVSSPGAGNR